MADVSVDGGQLRIRLGRWERFAAMHGDITVPLSAVQEVRVLDRALSGLRGIRAPGTGMPGVLAIGRRRGKFGRDFACVVGRGPGVVIVLRDASFSQIVLSADDPDAIRRLITDATVSP